MKLKSLLLVTLILLGINGIVSCSGSWQSEAFDMAESLMETHPDSALSILKGVDKSQLRSKAAQACYALLMSMALDKNYIDTATFDVLQPAIDYYLKKGSPDEKLRTYYYQGRIFQNKGDKDNALNSFIKGLDEAPRSNDSLCIARTLVAQAHLYKDFYDHKSYTENYLKAANIYKEKELRNLEFDCLLNVLNGAIILNNNERADSVINICNNFNSLTEEQKRILQGYRLSHAIVFGSKNDLKNIIDGQEHDLGYDANGILNLAYAYNKLGNNQIAKQKLDYLHESGMWYDILKYQSISVFVLEGLGNYKEAFSLYWDYTHRLDSINAFKFKQKAQSMEEKHEMELQAKNDSERKTKIIWSCVGGILILLMGVCMLVLLVRSNKVKRDLAVQKSKTTELENEKLKYDKELADRKAKTTQLENEKLMAEKERLDLENRNLQLERDNKILEAENLIHKIEALENESESLKGLLETHEDIPREVQQAIQVRIDMLNSLLASYITNNNQYGEPYEKWVKQLTENISEFMNSNRLAFQISHPRFIKYFEDHDLTVDEINYVCLYAIGLRGKEVGNYMKKRSHVNMSSAIRQKLGIDKHETNIGIYVRKLLKEL